MEGSVPSNDERVCSGGVTKAEALILIILFVIRSGLSMTGLKDALFLVNTLFGRPVVPSSLYMFEKSLNFCKNFDLVYYCLSCSVELTSTVQKDIQKCRICKKLFDVRKSDGSGFFLTASLASQLKSVLESFSDHSFLTTRFNRPNNTFSDICDGHMYKDLCKKFSVLGNPNNISFTFNTDGCPVFKSKNCSIWPLQLIINELPVFERFRNVILSSVWFGKNHPPMELYMKSFVQQCKVLCDQGFVWKRNGTEVLSKAFAVCCSVDSVARPLLQNMMQFNSYFGCGWCLHPGSLVNRSIRYTVSAEVADDRQSKSAIRDMREAASHGVICRGFKGPSALLNLPFFNVIESFVPDYMHAVLLGVSRTLLSLWFDSNTGGGFYLGDPATVRLVDRRMKAIKPPSKLGRFPRGVSERKLWKAQEYRSWLLYYSLPVLYGILPEPFLGHLALLVHSIFCLIQDTLTGDDINMAQILLTEFVIKYNMLYGDINMVFNVHLLQHLAKDVFRWGPLWTHSAFCFESYNGVLVKSIKGNRGVAMQVLHKAILKQSVNFYVLTKGTDVMKRSLAFFKDEKRCHSGDTVSGVTLLGQAQPSKFSNAEKRCIITALGTVPSCLSVFLRFIAGGVVYHSAQYSRPQRSDDTVVVLQGEKFGIIRSIFSYRLNSAQEVGLIVEVLEVEDAAFCGAPHIAVGEFSSLEMVAVSALLRKAVRVDVENSSFVCKVPNLLEIN
ncbi:uncharacterized protein LOC115319652 isoform X2 [Ixodes scapularis]|nr:uncharacterized protein LOC115319652 isoform X2 [Ixodes scapularis]